MKITSGRWVARYSIADSAFSALSTSSSYFSGIRARNRRADLESSTINARFTAMLAPIPTPKVTVWRKCSAERRGTRDVASGRRINSLSDWFSRHTGRRESQATTREALVDRRMVSYRSASRRAIEADDHVL